MTEPKRRRHKVYSGPNLSRERRRAVGSPCLSIVFSDAAIAQIEALLADGFAPAKEGRSGVVRRAIDAVYRERYGDADPREVLRRKR